MLTIRQSHSLAVNCIWSQWSEPPFGEGSRSGVFLLRCVGQLFARRNPPNPQINALPTTKNTAGSTDTCSSQEAVILNGGYLASLFRRASEAFRYVDVASRQVIPRSILGELHTRSLVCLEISTAFRLISSVSTSKSSKNVAARQLCQTINIDTIIHATKSPRTTNISLPPTLETFCLMDSM